ncbi:hypothetical protein [Moraxella bovis]|uniref:Uncharacterized protein n=1 Tax=Moraxella bovis TaxID=476 RepID=A0A378PXJ1_MORBO|nr:hypothetical protein [Moraxella bovis]STY91462.1 Uncharacterised protein [Moraxella bovis]
MNQEPLYFPIKFYKQKFITIFLIISLGLTFLFFFLEVFFDYSPTSHRGQLPFFCGSIIDGYYRGLVVILYKIFDSASKSMLIRKLFVVMRNIISQGTMTVFLPVGMAQGERKAGIAVSLI